MRFVETFAISDPGFHAAGIYILWPLISATIIGVCDEMWPFLASGIPEKTVN